MPSPFFFFKFSSYIKIFNEYILFHLSHYDTSTMMYYTRSCFFHWNHFIGFASNLISVYVAFLRNVQNEIDCAYYLRTGHCKFGSTCKFHHPQPANMMVSLRGSAVYPPVQSPTNAGQLSYPRASFIPSPRWQGPSSYAPMLLPQGMVSVPGWSAYSVTFPYFLLK